MTGPARKVRLPAPVFAAMLFAVAIQGLAGCQDSGLISAPTSDGNRLESGPAVSAAVVGVTDGDTLTVLINGRGEVKVRLAEIDAPEGRQPGGASSKAALAAMVAGRNVTLRQTGTDVFGRMVALVKAGDRDVNREMVAQGAAWAFRQYLTDQSLLEVEARARAGRRGLWAAAPAPAIAPWEWRNGVRVAPPPPAAAALAPRGVASVDTFKCEGKRQCGEMLSCSEAIFYLKHCSLSAIDGNGDGEPCERLCGTSGR